MSWNSETIRKSGSSCATSICYNTHGTIRPEFTRQCPHTTGKKSFLLSARMLTTSSMHFSHALQNITFHTLCNNIIFVYKSYRKTIAKRLTNWNKIPCNFVKLNNENIVPVPVHMRQVNAFQLEMYAFHFRFHWMQICICIQFFFVFFLKFSRIEYGNVSTHPIHHTLHFHKLLIYNWFCFDRPLWKCHPNNKYTFQPQTLELINTFCWVHKSICKDFMTL